jgi:hypothetical protein
MTIYLKIDSVGDSISTFNLYSDVDGFLVSFYTDMPKEELIAGTNCEAPINTSIVEIRANDTCSNSIYVTLTTTTTTTEAPS